MPCLEADPGPSAAKLGQRARLRTYQAQLKEHREEDQGGNGILLQLDELGKGEPPTLDTWLQTDGPTFIRTLKLNTQLLRNKGSE